MNLVEYMKFESDLTVIDLEYKFYNKLFLDEFLNKYRIINQLSKDYKRVIPTNIRLGEFGFGWSIDKFRTINYEVNEELDVIKDTFKDWKNDVAIPVVKKSDEFLKKCYRFNDITFLMTTIKDSSGVEVDSKRKKRYLDSIMRHDNYFVERKVQNNITKLLMFVENKNSKFDLKRCIDIPFENEVKLHCDKGSTFYIVPGEYYSVFVNDKNYDKDAGNMLIPIAWIKDDPRFYGKTQTIYYSENVLYTIKKSINNFSRIDKILKKYK